MADILKISTPLIDNSKTTVQPGKQVDPTQQFNLSEIDRVVQTNQQSEILKQHTGLLEQESPAILMNMLKDPSVTVSFLRNIYMLQEIIQLLPVNNSTLTQEIQQLFDSLLVDPKDVVSEMIRQEQTSTAFKGELFDFLRNLLSQSPKPEMSYGIANLLKSINGSLSRRNILDSVSNSFLFLAGNLKSSPKLAARLMTLSNLFRSDDAPNQFAALKGDALAVMKEIENSILFSPKIAKVLPLITYNLSRFNDNPDYLQDAASSLLTMIDGDRQKQTLMDLLYGFLTGSRLQPQSSRVMDVLADIINKQTAANMEGEEGEVEIMAGKKIPMEEFRLLSSEKIDKIVSSLLSSPCNYTPLLHFIVPVQDMDMKSFAEIWIDPNDEGETKRGGDSAENIHMLIVFDVDGIGRFEAELFVRQQDISLTLLCPPMYVSAFSGIATNIARSANGTGFRFKDIQIDRLERPRSLMDVFKALPRKRTGINMRV